MASKTKFVCNSCGYESSKWFGRCPECGSWNSAEETVVASKKTISSFTKPVGVSLAPQKIGGIKSFQNARLSTGVGEFDRVLGGTPANLGLVPGSVVLLSGDPGIGKSTLLLQLALNLAISQKEARGAAVKRVGVSTLVSLRSQAVSSAKAGLRPTSVTPSPRDVLYISGEESESQIKLRAERLIGEKGLTTSGLLVLSTTDIDSAMATVHAMQPDLAIVDSIQAMASVSSSSFPGSIPQIRYATGEIVRVAKSLHIPIILVGHVTKEGIAAGPMILSHMVDTVLYLEGERLTGTRILRAFKNRFGDTSEVGIFVMEEQGLSEIHNTEFFMNKKDRAVSGSCASVTLEGSRPLLIEIQALTVPSSLAFARRVASGIDAKRLELLLAVIQKRMRLPLERVDVFVNVVGGLRVTETAVDLAVCLAIISSFKNKPLRNLAAIGEIGLLGELKNVTRLDTRIKEAKKFGFARVISPENATFLHEAARPLV